jgi:hypothetical protein
MTRPARVTMSDMARAVRAADAGRVPRAVEIAPDGTIRIVPVDRAIIPQDPSPSKAGEANEWDEVLPS